MGAKKLVLVEYLETTSSSVVVSKESMCDELSIDTCKKYFAEYKCNHEVRGSYDDDKWYIKNQTTDMFVEIDFSAMILSYKEKLKKYAIVKLYTQDISVEYLKCIIKYITKSILQTSCFNKDYLESYKSEMLKREEMGNFALSQFLEFIQEGQEYVEFINTINKSSYPINRDIPGFQSIICFDRLINDVIENHPELIIKHYFILMWWKISTIIPMRPTEMVNLKRNCIYEKHNEYYIHIERIKNKYNRKAYSEPIMTEFLITKEMYDFIYSYIEYANSIDNDEYLISRKIYIQTLLKKIDAKHRVNRYDFYEMLNRFYKEVVEDVYGLEVVPLNEKEYDNQIEKVRLGDTRHLAIINLMMQGINPLEIMRLAGHHNVEAQMGYYSHVEKFMTTKTYVLSRMLKNNSTISRDNSTYDSGQKKIEKDLLGPAYYQLPMVAAGSGRCSSTNFPQECESSECVFCKCFLPENNLSGEYMMLLEEQNKKEIELKKETLQYVLKNHMCIENEELERASKDYITSLNQKLVIQSYKLNRKENTAYEE